MKLNLPKIKASKALFSLRYFYIFIALLLIMALTILGNFLHKNFYQTIAQTEEIILLKQEVAPDVIDINKVETVLNRLKQKSFPTEKTNFEAITDPFNIENIKPEPTVAETAATEVVITPTSTPQ